MKLEFTTSWFEYFQANKESKLGCLRGRAQLHVRKGWKRALFLVSSLVFSEPAELTVSCQNLIYKKVGIILLFLKVFLRHDHGN